MPISGYATLEGTTRIRERNLTFSQTYKTLGKTGLICSPIGFGSYRVDVRMAEHRAALSKSIKMGVNVIDTSANYSDGFSERLIGETLTTMIGREEVSRDEIILVSKGGYIQGENYKRISELVAGLGETVPESGTEFAEIVKYGKGIWHSVHPDFLHDQITRSLERLNVDTIDVYLLHNPEYFLQWAVKDNMPEDEARNIYDERIRRAFAQLEKEVAKGRIRWYGISSNTFVKAEGAIDRTSLEVVMKHAGPHFAVIQLPMNLFEQGGVNELNQEKASLSVIDFAKKHNIGVLINRPLNAIHNQQLIRLANYPEREFLPEEDINVIVHDINLQESEFKKEILAEAELNPQAKEAVTKLMMFGEWLDNFRWRELAGYDEWRDLLFTVLKPRIQYVFDLLRPLAKDDKVIFTFLEEYAESMDEAIEHITNFYTTKAAQTSNAIHDAVDEVLPSEYHELSLSQKAVLALRSVEGVSSVLVGMRSEEYVDDVVFGLHAKALDDAANFWKRLEITR
jgi:aryl-alcohol dehydrogenase-like predicted oxidoreductase